MSTPYGRRFEDRAARQIDGAMDGIETSKER